MTIVILLPLALLLGIFAVTFGALVLCTVNPSRSKENHVHQP